MTNQEIANCLNDIYHVWWKKYRDLPPDKLQEVFSTAWDEAAELMIKHKSIMARRIVISLMEELDRRVL